ncbi:Beta sliding clamp [Buchnera aphidicola (Neophyllaphis podocarpi)]|uniref:DNA polymerase III subunit beta n=1 Tax=Buchnera aphidicola TaxID=9 RepID=UPI003463D4DC
MKFSIKNIDLIKPLQKVASIIKKNCIYPILSNLLIEISNGILKLISTDLLVEIIVKTTIRPPYKNGSTTISANKILSICNNINENEIINIELNKNKISIKTNNNLSNFNILTLPVNNFPNIKNWKEKIKFCISQKKIKNMIKSVKFSMANNDVRNYLNGVLLEIKFDKIIIIATDGHRLSKCCMKIKKSYINHSIIIPRIGILELEKIIENKNEDLTILINENNLRVEVEDTIFNTKLIEGLFPKYEKIISHKKENTFNINNNKFKESLKRSSILANEKFCGIRLNIQKGKIIIFAKNNLQEEMKEKLYINYMGKNTEIAINVNYILDILNSTKSKEISFSFTDSKSSIYIKEINNNANMHLIMPLNL